jgi:hypothetical protein
MGVSNRDHHHQRISSNVVMSCIARSGANEVVLGRRRRRFGITERLAV